MSKIIELRIAGEAFYNLLRDVQAKVDFKPNSTSVMCRYFADEIEAGPTGYKIPVILLRRNKETNENLDIDGFVTVPYTLFLSIVEYEVDSEDKSNPRIGFVAQE